MKDPKAERAIELLRKVRPFLFSSGPIAVTAIYIPPAQQLRNQADQIEYQDALIKEVDEFLSKY